MNPENPVPSPKSISGSQRPTPLLALGLDAGGTKTAAVMVDEMGVERGRGIGGPGNIATSDEATLTRSVREAVEAACAQAGIVASEAHFEAVCAGVAGYSLEERRIAFQALLSRQIPARAVRLEPDYVAAFWGATLGEPGILLIAGTGSVAYGRNAQGEACKEDGLGYLLGDCGSGFDLGLHLIKQTLDRMQEGADNAISAAVRQATGATRIEALLQWVYGSFSPGRVASLAPIAGQLAEQGDPIARYYLAEMARRLRLTVRKVRHRLSLERDTPVYPLGGLWQLGAFFRQEFEEPIWTGEGDYRLEPEPLAAGRFTLAQPRYDAAFGAAYLALLQARSQGGGGL